MAVRKKIEWVFFIKIPGTSDDWLWVFRLITRNPRAVLRVLRPWNWKERLTIDRHDNTAGGWILLFNSFVLYTFLGHVTVARWLDRCVFFYLTNCGHSFLDLPEIIASPLPHTIRTGVIVNQWCDLLWFRGFSSVPRLFVVSVVLSWAMIMDRSGSSDFTGRRMDVMMVITRER